MADWYYGKDNAQHGPVSDTEIRNLMATGQITNTTLIWREGMTDWLPSAQVPEFGQPGMMANPYNTAQAYPGYIAPAPTDGLAIASMVCGILSLIVCYVWAVFGIPAVICGHMSLNRIKKNPQASAGKGMAIAGLVTGYIGIAIQFVMIAAIVIAIAAEA